MCGVTRRLAAVSAGLRRIITNNPRNLFAGKELPRFLDTPQVQPVPLRHSFGIYLALLV